MDGLGGAEKKNSCEINDKAIDEHCTKSFAKGFSFYKIFWLIVLFSILGFFIESVWCLIKIGQIESRKGLIYGPFNQIYGLGAIVMIICLRKVRNKGNGVLFFSSAILGGIFEYICSFIQQILFGSVSWEYSEMQFNINGRTNIIYALFWGALGTILIKYLYPLCDKYIEKIPYRIGIAISWILIVFILFDIFISISALEREGQRRLNIPPGNKFEAFLDEKYTDAYLNKVYPNMRFK